MKSTATMTMIIAIAVALLTGEVRAAEAKILRQKATASDARQPPPVDANREVHRLPTQMPTDRSPPIRLPGPKLDTRQTPDLSVLLAPNIKHTFDDGRGGKSTLTTTLYFSGKPTGEGGLGAVIQKQKNVKITREAGMVCETKEVAISMQDDGFMNAGYAQQAENIYPGASIRSTISLVENSTRKKQPAIPSAS